MARGSATEKQIDLIRRLRQQGKISDSDYEALLPLGTLSVSQASRVIEKATGISHPAAKIREPSGGAGRPSARKGRGKGDGETPYEIVARKASEYAQASHLREESFAFRDSFEPSHRVAEAEQKLADMFSFPSFRPGQARLVDAVLGGNDVLAIMPTGGGKSVCYQVPAAMLGGLTIVVSPLISLMHDQVAGMPARGLRGSYLDSTLSPASQEEVMRRALAGAYDVMYVSPERLESSAFTSFAKKADIRFLAIDEAHCVSQWGADFRPAYGRIPDFVAKMPRRPVVAAYTATATEEVRIDIAHKLDLRNPVLAVSGFDRPNLALKVEWVGKAKKEETAIEFVQERRGQCGVCYCLSRKEVDDLAEQLKARGVSVVAYHAGLSDDERNRAQTAWTQGRADVVVATSAFGMGIDRADVRYVLSTSIADSLEAYYQQAGRAGRDGQPADCVLYWCDQDLKRWDWLVEQAAREASLPEDERQAVLAVRYKQLLSMARYARERGCLRDHVLRHFGESALEDGGCGRCTGCERRAREALDRSRETDEASRKTRGQSHHQSRTSRASTAKRGGKLATAGSADYESESAKSPYFKLRQKKPRKPSVSPISAIQGDVEWACPVCHERNITRRGRSTGKCTSCGQTVRINR